MYTRLSLATARLLVEFISTYVFSTFPLFCLQHNFILAHFAPVTLKTFVLRNVLYLKKLIMTRVQLAR